MHIFSNSWIEKIVVKKKNLINIMNFMCYLLLIFLYLTNYSFIFTAGLKIWKKKLSSYGFSEIINLVQWRFYCIAQFLVIAPC